MSERNPDRGWAFPFRFDAGRVASVGGAADALPAREDLDAAVRAGVAQVIRTGQGERVMLGHFGVGAERYLFHPLGDVMAGFLSREVLEQVELWSPRTKVRSVETALDAVAGEVVVFLGLAHNLDDAESVLRFRID